MNRIYLRVSTDNGCQEFDRQVYILEKHGYVLSDCVVYQEKISGKSRKNREELFKMLKEIEKGDKVIITEISRLARSVIDLWEIANEINKVGANLISLKENIDLETAAGRLMFTMLSGMAQFERDVISERTVDALLAKKKNGMVLGRPRTIKPKVIDEAIQDYVNGGGTFKQVASKYKISDATLCNSVKKWRSQQNA